MLEIFKDVPGYEGLYQVSNLGNVMRVGGGQGVKSGRVLRLGVTHNGYHQVGLCKENVEKKFYVHRLVALTFLENPEGKKEVNHIDGVKSNNSLSNLEWSTSSENKIHSRDVLWNMIGEKNTMYGKFGASNPSSKTVVQLTREGVEVNRFGSTREAQRETGVHQQNIGQTCLGRYKSAGGFIWKYA